MTANKYLKDRLPIGDPTHWTDAEVEELMESYAQQVADEQKAALKKRIEDRISEHQSILAVLEVEEIGYQETAQTATTIIAVYETILYEIETLSQSRSN